MLETAQQVGRLSVSTASDVSYKEMAHHCEALLMGKQQKMSYLINTHNQQRQESLLIRFSQQSDENDKGMVSHIQTDISLKVVISFFISLVQHNLVDIYIHSSMAMVSFACSCMNNFHGHEVWVS